MCAGVEVARVMDWKVGDCGVVYRMSLVVDRLVRHVLGMLYMCICITVEWRRNVLGKWLLHWMIYRSEIGKVDREQCLRKLPLKF